MLRSENGFYKLFETVSRKKFKKLEEGTGVSARRKSAFVKNLNKFVELCGDNESEAGRRLGVSAQVINGWRSGAHVPSLPAQQHIASVLGVDHVTLMHGETKISELASNFGRVPSKKANLLLEVFETVVKNADALEDARVLELLRDGLYILDAAVERRARELKQTRDTTVSVVEDVAAAETNRAASGQTSESVERKTTPGSEKRNT